MPSYLHPGVFVQEIPSGAKPIEGVGTSVPAFIGVTNALATASTGSSPTLAAPVMVVGWEDYKRNFSDVQNLGPIGLGDPMSHSVRAFFNNGGGYAYIVSLPPSVTGVAAKASVPATGSAVFILTAVGPGIWANSYTVRFAPVSTTNSAGQTVLLVNVSVGTGTGGTFSIVESFSSLSLDPSSPFYLVNVINNGSSFFSISSAAAPTSVSGGDLSTMTATQVAGLVGYSLVMQVDSDYITITLAAGANTPSDFFNQIVSQANASLLNLSNANPSKPVRTLSVSPTSGTPKSFTLSAAGAQTLAIAAGTVTGKDAASSLGLGTVGKGTETSVSQIATLALTNVLKSASGVMDIQISSATVGVDAGAPTDSAYDAALALLEKIAAVNVLCLPSVVTGTKPTGTAVTASYACSPVDAYVASAATAHANKMRRIVIIDPPFDPNAGDLDVLSYNPGVSFPDLSVLYYPWLSVPNPLYTPARPSYPTTVFVPPNGFAAGMWARIDNNRGVWKAPAGTETSIGGVSDLQFHIGDAEQDQLNPQGVNAIRNLPGFGTVFWGARTLATNSAPEWRYVPVRRTALFLELSIYNGIQWAVFEPNDTRLWSSLRLNVEGFMNGLFRAGAFQGATATDAYFVRCGLGDTMTQADIDAGNVILTVGFAPLKPAEFVILQIEQAAGQS